MYFTEDHCAVIILDISQPEFLVVCS